MIRVAVLGSTGMVGHAVSMVLSRNPQLRVQSYTRLTVDAMNPQTLQNLKDVDYVINCIGIIWQANNNDPRQISQVNTTFPWALQLRCQEINAKLIHVSTDCVFSGKTGNYTENDQPDSYDTYGLSKYLGEPNGAMVLRTSIIGRELGTKRSLVEWARSSFGTQVRGYTNHVWNGVTSQEFGRICGDIISRGLWKPGIFHVHGDAITKHDLLKLINARYCLLLDIVPHETPQAINRTLATIDPLCQQLNIPGIQEMIDGLS